MSKTPSDVPQNSEDDLLAEYQFNYQQAKPNRFATRDEAKKLTVVLDEDVARVFKTPEAVNRVLRALIETMPK